jgi:hypothetical protein
MSQHKSHREKDSRSAGKKSSNVVVTRQSSGENKNTEKYTKVLEDVKRKSSTTHQETATGPTVDVVAASR